MKKRKIRNKEEIVYCYFNHLRRFKVVDLLKSLLIRPPGQSRGPELIETTGFRLSPE
jgi:hypothetical protein